MDVVRRTAAAFSFRYLLGLGCVLLVVVLWVGSGFVIEHVYEQYSPKPFFITYFNTASFSLNFLVLALKCLLEPLFARFRSKSSESVAQRDVTVADLEKDTAIYHADQKVDLPVVTETAAGLTPEHVGERNLYSSPDKQAADSSGTAPVSSASERTVVGPPRATFRETLVLAFHFCILWFAANWAANAAYNFTTVPNVSILSSTSGFFTLLVGAIFRIEKFSWKKFLAVVICLAGVVLVMTTTGSGGKESGLLGDLLALLSALLYGFYATLVKRSMGEGESVSPSLFFGLVGVLNIVMLWPGFLALHYAGVEPFKMPSSRHFWSIVIPNAVFGTFLSDYAWLWAVLLTSPLVVTLGISFTIPVSIIAESLIKGRSMSVLYFLGALLVIVGFLLVNLASARQQQQNSEESETR